MREPGIRAHRFFCFSFHLRSSAEFIMTRTEPALCTSAPTTGLSIPVIARISIPFNLDNQEEKENKLTEKELKAKGHLEEMVDITRHLSYNDIYLLKKNVKDNHVKNMNIENISKEQDERQK